MSFETEEVDQLIEEASGKWYAYGVIFGKHKTNSDSPFATVIISVYITKWETVRRKFTAPTLSLAMVEVKKWLADPGYVQLESGTIDEKSTVSKKSASKKEDLSPNLFS